MLFKQGLHHVKDENTFRNRIARVYTTSDNLHDREEYLATSGYKSAGDGPWRQRR